MAEAARILLIEDDAAARRTLRDMLERGGHQVRELCNGTEAVPTYAAWKPRVVVTDILMPETEGIETIMALRRAHPDCKIVAVSGGGGANAESHLGAAMALGAVAGLAKPFCQADLLRAVSDALLQA